MNITKALADENRVRVLLALRKGELCVCQITELFGLAPSTVSKHLSILFQADLVESRKDGLWIYYSLAYPRRPFHEKLLDCLANCFQDVPELARDARRLKSSKCDKRCC